MRSAPIRAARRADPESQTWIDRLEPGSTARDAAIVDLHALLLNAARFEIARRGAAAHLRSGDRNDLAQQSADDALIAVLAQLGDFRGQSRFTTWASKFALFEAAVAVRRRAWEGREVALEPDGRGVPGGSASARAEAETEELKQAIPRALGPRERSVLTAVAFDGVPIDVVAERLGSTRGAVYTTICDARTKLRAAVAAVDPPSPAGS